MLCHRIVPRAVSDRKVFLATTGRHLASKVITALANGAAARIIVWPGTGRTEDTCLALILPRRFCA